ncbi:hypothetical protein P8452_14901 [Trifolium repens]|nr:hypothetical protein P8452_14901 [Trifolium repens]
MRESEEREALGKSRAQKRNGSEKKEVPPSTPAEGSSSALKEVNPGGPYRNALLGKSGLRSQEVSEITAAVNMEFVKELKESMVGTLAKEKDVRRIQSILYMEGFPSVIVSHMGGNLVLIRSKVEGDVGRLIRSKNECLKYFFSEIKPWGPGLRTVQREVWVQVYEIPLHVWGDSFFKLVGSKLGVFLDFDFETASMARFDVARLKILTSSWEIIDTVIKVVVEGAIFNVWAVEERSNQRSAVVLGDGVEDEGSAAVPSEESGEVAEGYVAGVENSEEDEPSGPENDGDVRIQIQHGGNTEKERDRSMCDQVPKGDNCLLTCAKSTNVCDTQRDILTCDPTFVENEIVMEQVAKETEGVVPIKVYEEDKYAGEGPRSVEECAEAVDVVGGVGHAPVIPCVGDSIIAGHGGPVELGLNNQTSPFAGPNQEEEETRVSFISEPEDVLLSHLSVVPKKVSKWRKHKQSSKFPQLGVPKCLQLVEAVQEGVQKSRRRRHKGGGGTAVGERSGGTEEVLGRSESSGNEDNNVNLVMHPQFSSNHIANSGINLILEDGDSLVPETQNDSNEGDRALVVEAAKLLQIQKEVGFSFEVVEDVTIKQLVEQEECDRAKKLAMEGRNGDQ